MTRRPWNLATRPFRNQTLPALLLAAGWFALLAGSAVHALAARRLLPARTSARHGEVRDLEARLERLDARAGTLKRNVPEGTLKEWLFVKDLVDRRAFSWTRLLHDLEEALPADARVTSLAPEVTRQRLELKLDANVRAAQDGLELVRRLEAREEFEHVNPESAGEAQGGGRQLRLRMFYDPPPEPAPARRKAGKRGPQQATE